MKHQTAADRTGKTGTKQPEKGTKYKESKVSALVEALAREHLKKMSAEEKARAILSAR